MTRTDARVQDLLSTYGAPDADVAYLLCDRHPADAVACTIVEPDLSPDALTYGELQQESRRLAARLVSLGVEPGDRVATLLGKTAEHVVALLAIWRAGAVHVPLFTAFAPPAIAMRLQDSGAKAVIVDDDQLSKLAPGDDMPADPRWRILVAGAPIAASADHDDPCVAVGGDGPMVQIYTSGTTGRPKPVVVPVKALASFHVYMELGLDVRPDDVYWNAADPGWAYGLYYGVIGPLCTGIPNLWLHSGFSADLTWQVLDRFGVTNFAAAPTVYRALRASGAAPADLRLRCASAAGEPLTPEVNEWAPGALGVPVRDHYGQTEAGMLVNNHHHPARRRALRPGSMGHVMSGWSGAVLQADRDEPAPTGTVGRLAFDLDASPLAWRRTGERWYVTGDAAYVDPDGYFHFSSRDDDVIIMAGYRIGPFDVESVLVAHDAVVEAAAIGAPDARRGEVVEAYVVLRDSAHGTPALAAELQELVKRRLAAHAYPRTVHFVPELPKTPSGKLQRFLLRERRRAELTEERAG